MEILNRFIYWYLVDMPRKWQRGMKHLSPFLVEFMGLKIHSQYFWAPMFHDRTVVGRGLSVAFRLIFIVTGFLVWIFGMIAGFLFIVMWFGWILFSLIHWLLSLIVVLVILMLFARRLSNSAPWGIVEGRYSWEAFCDSADRSWSGLLTQFPTNLGDWWGNPQVQWWLGRFGWLEQHLPVSVQIDREAMASQIWSRLVQEGRNEVLVGDILQAVALQDPYWQQMIRDLEQQPEDMEEVLRWHERDLKWWRKQVLWDENFNVGEMAGFNRAMTGLRTPTLDLYSQDWTAVAARLPHPVGKQSSYQTLLAILSRSRGENVMILGENGVGKSTFVGGLAQMIMNGTAPATIRNKRLVKLEPGRLLAGTHTQTDAAGRLVKLLDDIKRSEDIILFIDEIHTLMTVESSLGGMSLFSVMQEALANSRIQLIGATTARNFKRYIEPYEAFAKMFAMMSLDEPADAAAIEIMEYTLHEYEQVHGVVYSYQSVKAAVVLSRRYIQEKVLPEKSKEVLDEAGVLARNHGMMVTVADVEQVVSRQSGVPVHKVDVGEKQELLDLESKIHQGFVGQDVAVRAVADALRRARLDIRSEARPIGSFMFVGPTGVGKTELSRQLAKVYFGSENAMIRLDMTEFSQPHMISRLIGAPVGSAGYEVGGELTEKVRKHPFSLVLLDELEKAHPKVWDLLLQVMDDGRLTDASGLTVDFRHTIIIVTSNAVTAYIQEQIKQGRNLEGMDQELFDLLTQTFRVEMLNRFDKIVPFAPLQEDELVGVVRLEMNKLVARMAERHIMVTYTEDLVRDIGRRAAPFNLGARPIRRILQDKVETYIASALLRAEKTVGMELRLGVEVLD